MHTKFPVLLALIVAGLFAFVGCTDSFVAYDAAEAEFTANDGPKFRHAHLLDRAVRNTTVGKGASSSSVGLIIKAQGLVSRYGIVSRYGLVSRYEYDEIFYGLAAEVEQSRLDSVLAEMENDPDIIWVEPDFDIDAQPSEGIPGSAGQMIPWSVALIGGMESAAQSGDGQGSVDIDIYVLDTGVSNDDINVTEDLDFRDSLNVDPTDYEGHGTHIAGIAAAVDDTDGLVGIAPGARVHNLKVLSDDGTSDASVVLAAVEHVLAAKLASPSTPMVVNLSLGEDTGNSVYTALDEAMETSVDAGVVYVVAAGNHGMDAQSVTPAKVESAITVGSFDVLGRFSPFSNYGSGVDILAPGEAVVSLSPGTGLPVEMTGTSMAAAHVTGAAALYLSQNPTASPQQVRDALVANAQDFVTEAPSNTTTKSVWVGEEGTGGISETYRDEFNTLSFGGNDGTVSWLGDWQEIGESNGATSGQVRVESIKKCVVGSCLRLSGWKSNRGASRAVDLSEAVSATLTFDAKRNNLGNTGHKLEISTDGGATWTVLKSYAPGEDNQPQHESYDISAYMSANTQVRFHSYTHGSGTMTIDNVQIETNSVVAGGEFEYDNHVLDAFTAKTYTGNDGTLAWSNDWQELGESNGPGMGKVSVRGTYCADGNCLRLSGSSIGRGASREVDLSGVSSARFSFDWRRLNLAGTVDVQVSRNGGQSWTTLMTITPGDDNFPLSESFDVTAFLSSNTEIRFIKTIDEGGKLFIDNVMIEFSEMGGAGKMRTKY